MSTMHVTRKTKLAKVVDPRQKSTLMESRQVMNIYSLALRGWQEISRQEHSSYPASLLGTSSQLGRYVPDVILYGTWGVVNINIRSPPIVLRT